MAIARHGRGVRAGTAALASQVHPVFMLPPLATSAFGAVLARTIDLRLAALHLLAVFFALYTAHVKDGYVDYYHRDEDDDHPLTAGGCRVALAGATVAFVAALAAIAVVVGPVAAALTLPGWVIGYLHAPQLDSTTLGATAGYPAGVALALVGGYYVQAGGFPPTVLAFAAVFLVILTGIKTIDDTTDHAHDRSIGKPTVAVRLGPARARSVAYGVMALGLAAVLALATTDVFPAAAALAPVAFGAVAVIAYRAGDRDAVATALLIRGAYLFLAVLVVAVWLGPPP